MQRGSPTDMSDADLRVRESIPKNVLYAMVKHMAAQLDGDSYDESIADGSYFVRMHEEWRALYGSGIVTQRPPTKVWEF